MKTLLLKELFIFQEEKCSKPLEQNKLSAFYKSLVHIKTTLIGVCLYQSCSPTKANFFPSGLIAILVTFLMPYSETDATLCHSASPRVSYI